MKKYIFSLLSIAMLIAVPFTLAGQTGALSGRFTVNENGKTVCFSKGNLQYQASTNTWRFAEHQWDIVGHRYKVETGDDHFVYKYTGTVDGSTNEYISPTNSKWIDLFGWGTSGAAGKKPYTTSMRYQDYASGNGMTIAGTDCDWGVFNRISNGGNKAGLWRTLTYEEWSYLLFERRTAKGFLFVYGTVNDIHGLILLPDNWNGSAYSLTDVNDPGLWEWTGINKISASDWNRILEPAGAVFLPCAGTRGDLNYENMIDGMGTGPEGALPFNGSYWSSSLAIYDPSDIWTVAAYYLLFGGDVRTNYSMPVCMGHSVRLVADK